ncbi:ribonuclease HII [Patescibacteria group bacterium]
MLNLDCEKRIFSRGVGLLGALDEAGRGPLAGPVVAVCVVINPKKHIDNHQLRDVKDSKKMTENRREELFNFIYDFFDEVGVGICDHKTIDRINVLEASFLAMKKAIGFVRTKPNYVILDGQHRIPNFSISQEAIIKGDESVFSIASASIIAKVTRDRIMRDMHELYPEYSFDQHKGYGTKLHLERLGQHGPCPIHRKSFRPVKSILAERQRAHKYA